MVAELRRTMVGTSAETQMTVPLSTAEQLKVKIERHALLLRGAPVAIIVTAVNVLVTLAVVWGRIDPNLISVWAAAALTLSGARLALWARARVAARKENGAAALLGFTRIHVTMMAVNGALWGALAPIFAASGLLSHAFLPFIIAGMSAAAVSSAGASWKAVMSFNAPALTALAVSYALFAETGGATIAAVVCLYGVAIGYLAWNTEQLITRSIRLRSRNDGQVRALERQLDTARDAEKRFRALVEASCDLTLIFSPDGRITYASPASQTALGLAPAELVGRTTRDIVHPNDISRFRAIGAHSLAKLGDVEPVAHICLKRGDGAYALFSGRITNMLYVPGVEGFVFNGGLVREAPCRAPQAAE